jgi:CheY-like chemotaxis protein
MKAQQLPLNSLPANLLIAGVKDDSMHYVVIDDDSINNMVCKAAIKSATGGKIASCFNNPVEALRYFENEYLAIHKGRRTTVFLDLNMPEMSGWEWLEKYNDIPENIKSNITVYILSSSVNPTDIDRARSNRLVKDYIIKPLTKAKVLDLTGEDTPSLMQLKVV